MHVSCRRSLDMGFWFIAPSKSFDSHDVNAAHSTSRYNFHRSCTRHLRLVPCPFNLMSFQFLYCMMWAELRLNPEISYEPFCHIRTAGSLGTRSLLTKPPSLLVR